MKEQRTARNLVSLQPITNLCSNCQMLPEHTLHLMYTCNLSQQIWSSHTDIFNDVMMLQGDEGIELTRDNIMFNHPPDATSESHQYDIIDTIIVIKHALYRLKFRENVAIFLHYGLSQ